MISAQRNCNSLLKHRGCPFHTAQVICRTVSVLTEEKETGTLKIDQFRPKRPVWSRRSLLGMAFAAAAISVPMRALAQSGAAVPVAPELLAGMPPLRMHGRTRLTVWGFRVYDVQLWVAQGFAASRPTASVFALDLIYLRKLNGLEIAKRSVAEMQAQAELAGEDEARWSTFMQRTFKDVGNADRLIAFHAPGSPTRFVLNGAEIGRISDARFDVRFFDIWLGPKTSEPAMRQALLEGSSP